MFASTQHRFSAWLGTLNSGEKERFQEFLQFYKTPSEHDVDQDLHFAHMVSGLELRKMEKVTPTQLIGIVQEKDSDRFARFVFEVEATPTHLITKIDIQRIDIPEEFSLQPMSESQAIEAVKANLDLLAERGKFSGTVLVAKNGKVIFLRLCDHCDGKL